ncbi:MAG: amidohydrolase family protein, partial [Pyrinomonadaceae bacterium]
MRILAADHVLPISSEPIVGGAIAVADDSIVAVGKGSDLRLKFPDAHFEDFGDAAILPGFVNCHA